MGPRSRRRQATFRLLLAAGGLVFALLVGELAVRLVLPQYVSIQTDRAIWEHDEELGWIGRRGAEVLQGFDQASTVPVRINSRGFRDDEWPYERTPGGSRFVVLGDSVAFGFGVAESDRLTEVAERELACHGAEFVNLGVSGYSTDQELLAYRREGASYEPDGVVLVYVANDRRQNGRPSAYGHPKPAMRLEGGELVLGNVPVSPPGTSLRMRYALQRSSALFNLARESSRSVARSTGINRWAHGGSAGGDGNGASKRRSLELTQRLVLELRDEVEASGAGFLVVVAVTDANLDRRSPGNVELLDWCPTVGLDCLDTHRELASRAAAEPAVELFLQDQLHWTASGHEAAGLALSRRILELGWLPSAC